jgi:hypothetical protein
MITIHTRDGKHVRVNIPFLLALREFNLVTFLRTGQFSAQVEEPLLLSFLDALKKSEAEDALPSLELTDAERQTLATMLGNESARPGRILPPPPQTPEAIRGLFLRHWQGTTDQLDEALGAFMDDINDSWDLAIRDDSVDFRSGAQRARDARATVEVYFDTNYL